MAMLVLDWGTGSKLRFLNWAIISKQFINNYYCHALLFVISVLKKKTFLTSCKFACTSLFIDNCHNLLFLQLRNKRVEILVGYVYIIKIWKA
jgi:hypothetical protein